VDDVGSTSSVGLGFLHEYPLVGGGDVTDSYCGNFSGYKICLNVAAHEHAGKSGVFTRKIHFSCGKLTCPLCTRSGWATKEARKVTARLNVASERIHLDVEHIVISFGHEDYGIGDEKVLRAKALKACEDLGIIGGDLIFHGSRHRRFEPMVGGGFRQFGTDWSPHEHDLGFIEGGYTCRDCERKSNCLAGCGGFDDRRWQYYQKTGIYVKVLPKRKTIGGTAYYQLHHASIRRDAKRAHVGTWHGVCSYRNMGKVKVIKEAGGCPVCGSPLQEGAYVGKKNFVLNRYSPDYERDSMQDLAENGVVVWYVVPKGQYGRSSVGDSSARKVFNVKFAGGHYA
jgi:hypothetical protein